MTTGANRRTVLLGAGAAGISAAVAACGGDGDTDSPSAGTPDKTDSGPTSGGDSGGDGGALAKVSDVPVGGGKVFPDQDVVLTQPTEGKIMGFSATCTHKGCTLANVTDGTINCKCHGSKFDAANGEVKAGPATKPLPGVEVTVKGEEI